MLDNLALSNLWIMVMCRLPFVDIPKDFMEPDSHLTYNVTILFKFDKTENKEFSVGIGL